MRNYAIITLQIKQDELERQDSAWKAAPKCMNRSQYIRQAINHYSNTRIFNTEEV